MDNKKSGEREFYAGFTDSSQNDCQKKAKKSKLTSNFTDSDEDAICGERVASFLVAPDFTKENDSNHYSKEAFHPSRPILWTRGKYKSRDVRAQSSQNRSIYSDMVARRTENDLPMAKNDKNDGVLAYRTKNQRSTGQAPSEANNTANREEFVEKKKAISHKRCFESSDASANKDEKYTSIPRMRSEREDILSVEKKGTKEFKAASPENCKCSPEENIDKGLHKATTVSKKERFNGTESKKKVIPGSKTTEKDKVSERSIQVYKEYRKSAKVRGSVKHSVGKKVAKTVSNVHDKDELKSKSENHVNAAFTGHHVPGRIPGTYSLVDIEKLKQKHSKCCRECLEARARSAGPVKKSNSQEDTKKMVVRKLTVDGSSSEDQLENSIVFFRNALNAVDLLERLFQNIGSTKEFLQNVYNGLEESSDVARCRRNSTDVHLGDESAANQTIVAPKNESPEKMTSENHDREDESKKGAGKSKKKEHSKIKFKSSGHSTGQKNDTHSLRQDQKSKPKRDRDKNLLELSDEWKKRNHNVKP